MGLGAAAQGEHPEAQGPSAVPDAPGLPCARVVASLLLGRLCREWRGAKCPDAAWAHTHTHTLALLPLVKGQVFCVGDRLNEDGQA